MAYRDLKTGEMIDITREWMTDDKRAILESAPLTAPFTGPIDGVHDQLAQAHKRRPEAVSTEERKQLYDALVDLDDVFDDSARVLDRGFSCLALAEPERAADYERARTVLFPEGLQVVNTGYRNEAGETERIVERVEADDVVKGLLADTRLNGKPLSTWFDRLVDVGRRMGPVAARYELKDNQSEDVILEFKARQAWVQLVNTLRRTAELAGWTDEQRAAFFGAADRLAATRARSKPAPAPGDAPVATGGATPSPTPAAPAPAGA